ncbi:MAG: DUF262 domain-containing protein [Thermodesulfovibrionales bacterium]|nr:DUF262 domain-containing protein [Thermodesulfovibrionales bacterium]
MPKLESETLDIEKEDEQADEVLIEYDITTYPSDNTLEVLHKMWGDGKKDITIPDFQRGFVWSIQQSSKLIESFLIGLPVPPVFFYIDKENKNLVVDGQQRILSIMFFFEGYFGQASSKRKRQIFKLTGLNNKSPFNNKTFEELTDSEQRKLNGSVLRAINIRQLSPKEENTSIYHIFERLNTGGTPLTSQEIRNVVFRGKFLNKLKTLNDDVNWRLIIGKKTPDKHQKDVELILRVFGLAHHLNKYEKPMTEFLNKTAKKYKKDSEAKVVSQFAANFSKACKIIKENIRQKPFNVRGPLNTSALDSVFCTILNNLDHIPNNLNDRYNKLITDDDFVNYTSFGTTDAKTVKDRFSYVKRKLID